MPIIRRRSRNVNAVEWEKRGTLYYAMKNIASLALDDLEGVSKCSMFFWSASREAISTGAHCRIDAIISHLLWLASYTLLVVERAIV